jgi:hypothetical protein
MLFGPEHALQVAADAIEGSAKSPDMAVGITLGIKAAIVEYNRLFSTTPPAPVKAREDDTPTLPGNAKSSKPGALSRR